MNYHSDDDYYDDDYYGHTGDPLMDRDYERMEYKVPDQVSVFECNGFWVVFLVKQKNLVTNC